MICLKLFKVSSDWSGGFENLVWFLDARIFMRTLYIYKSDKKRHYCLFFYVITTLPPNIKFTAQFL